MHWFTYFVFHCLVMITALAPSKVMRSTIAVLLAASQRPTSCTTQYEYRLTRTLDAYLPMATALSPAV